VLDEQVADTDFLGFDVRDGHVIFPGRQHPCRVLLCTYYRVYTRKPQLPLQESRQAGKEKGARNNVLDYSGRTSRLSKASTAVCGATSSKSTR
jgi:hypothetical protein